MELKYGLTMIVPSTGKRERILFNGKQFSSEDKAKVFSTAALYTTEEDVRIVKITTRPKGWQPTTSKPEIGEVVLIRTIDGSAFMMTGYRDDCSVWRSMPTLRQVPGTVTHWRHLPKPPKDIK